tara:strand:- start:1444 stop:1629 length:186 start_codon:yes stop_codon:yes gene_type:complete
VETVASIQVPDDSKLTITMTMSVAEWAQMRDDVNSLLTKSIPLAEMAMQLNALIEKAQARI